MPSGVTRLPGKLGEVRRPPARCSPLTPPRSPEEESPPDPPDPPEPEPPLGAAA